MPVTNANQALTWGHGPKVLDVFLEPTCPFSGKAYAKLPALLTAAGENKLTIRLRIQSQPWHMFSPITTRAVLAASTLPHGRDAVMHVLSAIFNHRDAFEPQDHCKGELLNASAAQILGKIESLSGVQLKSAFFEDHVTTLQKWHARYARQNGIHVSPTFMLDGIVIADMSSGDEVSDWLKKLGFA